MLFFSKIVYNKNEIKYTLKYYSVNTNYMFNKF